VGGIRRAAFEWADVVFVTGMHIQAPQIHDIRNRAKAAGKVAALGGPSVSASPDIYPDYDYLHVGELGDATDQLIARLDESIAPLDSDTTETEARLNNFVDRSQIPMLTMNLLQALPKTPLWERLVRDGRLVQDSSRESNVRFLRPYEEVVATWRRCIAYAYDPQRLYARFLHQIEATYVNRFAAPGRGRLTRSNLKRGARLVLNLLFRVGLCADYRKSFWRTAWQAIKRGQIESFFGVGFISYHLIEFSREALRGEQNASFYSTRARRARGDGRRAKRASSVVAVAEVSTNTILQWIRLPPRGVIFSANFVRRRSQS
jgi:Domain of unknown function (DUF4070)